MAQGNRDGPPTAEGTVRLTKHLVIVGIAVGFGILGWVLPPAAWAQTPPPEVAEADEWSFTPGRIELGA
jgi:hypothetical protein